MFFGVGGTSVGVLVGVLVDVLVLVMVGTGVDVLVGVLVLVMVGTGVDVLVGVFVRVMVGTGIATLVGICVRIAVGSNTDAVVVSWGFVMGSTVVGSPVLVFCCCSSLRKSLISGLSRPTAIATHAITRPNSPIMTCQIPVLSFTYTLLPTTTHKKYDADFNLRICGCEPQTAFFVTILAIHFLNRGSNTSRRPSPSKFTPSTANAMSTPGKTVIHHARLI